MSGITHPPPWTPISSKFPNRPRLGGDRGSSQMSAGKERIGTCSTRNGGGILPCLAPDCAAFPANGKLLVAIFYIYTRNRRWQHHAIRLNVHHMIDFIYTSV